MTKEITVRDTQALTFSKDEIETIKQTVAVGATDAELKMFIYQCQRTGMDPFSRQIYFIKRRVWNGRTKSYDEKATIQSSIDGFRLVAERSKKYAGQTLPVFLDTDGMWHEVWTQPGYPLAAKVGVHRTDFKEPLYAIAKWDSYVQQYDGKVGSMWAKMPEVMLGKVAEALALRKAFPNDLSGVYTSEEMQQADTPAPRMEPFKVERIVAAEDDDEQSEPVAMTAKVPDENMEIAYDLARTQIKNLLLDLGEKIATKPQYIAALKKHTDLAPVPENYSKILQILREKSPMELLGEKDV